MQRSIEQVFAPTIEIQNESVMPRDFIKGQNSIDINFKDIDVAEANEKYSDSTAALLKKIDADIAKRQLTP